MPQFIDPAKGNVIGQNLMLGGIFIGMTLITDSLYALLASSLAEKLAGNRNSTRDSEFSPGLIYTDLGVTTALVGSRK